MLSRKHVEIGRVAFDPHAGLALLDCIADAPELRAYAPLPAARGDFLLRAGRPDDARAQFLAAARCSRNAQEKVFLLARAAACGPQPKG